MNEWKNVSFSVYVCRSAYLITSGLSVCVPECLSICFCLYVSVRSVCPFAWLSACCLFASMYVTLYNVNACASVRVTVKALNYIWIMYYIWSSFCSVMKVFTNVSMCQKVTLCECTWHCVKDPMGQCTKKSAVCHPGFPYRPIVHSLGALLGDWSATEVGI